MMRMFVIVLVFATAAASFFAQSSDPSSLKDPVTLLAKRIESGELNLDYATGEWGYLPSLLRHLDINTDTQVLVFSKTSFQLSKISPKTPRAIYFSDTVAVGAVQEGNVFELTSLDPSQGLIYYTMETQKAEKPRFERRFSECLNCHGPAAGLVVSSVYPSQDGTPFVTGTFFEGIDHRTPIENRWGGWYVSGTHGSMRHLGNAIAPDPDRPFDLQEEGTQNLTSLSQKFDTARYLEPTSDIVSLMVLEHQARMTNLIRNLGQQFRRGLNNGTLESSKSNLDRAVEQIVDYMLFVDEAPLRAPVVGVSTFAATFPQRGPRDSRGRSLRDLDLKRRLFKYPLSFMIYSEAFDTMPLAARERIYRRLYQVLSGEEQGPRFTHLSTDDRWAILEILRETKPASRPESTF